ncbi:hypothetical protein HK17_11665 [Acetobacter indonesiensis]|uniref:Uncharacterized protein n=1 Tax=Acetobacter indonesiensis TaxID=104101 RepID=A0A252ANR8_9PROT|nr:hypothetical protein HK17_11665 [Acetobacter indonesiensis]
MRFVTGYANNAIWRGATFAVDILKLALVVFHLSRASDWDISAQKRPIRQPLARVTNFFDGIKICTARRREICGMKTHG